MRDLSRFNTSVLFASTVHDVSRSSDVDNIKRHVGISAQSIGTPQVRIDARAAREAAHGPSSEQDHGQRASPHRADLNVATPKESGP